MFLFLFFEWGGLRNKNNQTKVINKQYDVETHKERQMFKQQI